MNTYWMFWWGRTNNPLHELNPLHWIGVLLVILFFCVICAAADLPIRVLLCMATSSLIWVYWISQAKKMTVPVNLLVPGFHQRLLKTSMAHWLGATLLFAFAATVRGRPDYFFAVGLLLGYGLLALTWLTRLRNAWIAVPGSMGVIWGAWYLAQYLRFNDYSSFVIAILAMGWAVMPVLAWHALNTLLRDGTARKLAMEQASRRAPFRDALHQWFLRRMVRTCSNTALPPKVLARVRLEARLNACFGPKFHWSAFFVSWPFIYLLILSLISILSTRSSGWLDFIRFEFLTIFIWLSMFGFWVMHHGAQTVSNRKLKMAVGWNKKGNFDIFTKTIDNSNAVLTKGLLLLAPGLPQGLAFRQARSLISLRYSLIAWVGSVALYTLTFSGLGAAMAVQAVVMISVAELAIIGRWINGPLSGYFDLYPDPLLRIRIPSSIAVPVNLFLTIIWPTVSTKYVWMLFMFAPEWYLTSISLPLWTASCLLGGAAYLWLQWQKLANEPDGLPAEWR